MFFIRDIFIIPQPLISVLFWLVVLFATPVMSSVIVDSHTAKVKRPPILGNSPFKIIEERDHDPAIFTQGFDYHNGIFYSSSGLFGRSFVRIYKDSKISLDRSSKAHRVTSDLIKQVPLSRRFFAEGIVKLDEFLYLLTWKSGKLLKLDSKTLNIMDTWSYQGEGWGITHNGDHFIMSNGSEHLYFRDTKTFDIKKTIKVSDGRKEYRLLNELEYANGFIWANVWLSNYILKIRPSDGQVVERFDLTEIVDKNMTRPMNTVLNGIAYDEEHKAFWVTGKYWPKKYLIQF